MPWEVEFIDEALRDLRTLDAYNRKLVLKAVSKAAERPLPPPEGVGKPLGHRVTANLSGCYKIKLRDLGYRVVYTLVREQELMRVIIISIRADGEVYREAERRLRSLN